MKTRASFAAGWKLMCLAVLLAIVLSAGVSHADKGADWGTIQLANVGDEPLAWGVAALTNVRSVKFDWPFPYPQPGPIYAFSCQLSLTCEGLTPGATYATPVGEFLADSTGAGKVKGKWGFAFMGDNWLPVEVDVDRLDPDGSNTTVLVGYIDGPAW